jgi:hypothetical protein
MGCQSIMVSSFLIWESENSKEESVKIRKNAMLYGINKIYYRSTILKS